MTAREHLKLELMVFATNNDFFGYGSSCKKIGGHWVSIVDAEKYTFTGKQMADQWDELPIEDRKDIYLCFGKKELGIE